MYIFSIGIVEMQSLGILDNLDNYKYAQGVPLILTDVIKMADKNSKIWGPDGKSEGSKQNLNKRLRDQEVKLCNFTYISDNDTEHHNTPVLFLKDAMIYLGTEKHFISPDEKIWKIILWCDVIAFKIDKDELEFTTRKLFRFLRNERNTKMDVMANIAHFLKNSSNFPKDFLERGIDSSLNSNVKRLENPERLNTPSNSMEGKPYNSTLIAPQRMRPNPIALKIAQNAAAARARMQSMTQTAGRRRKTKRAKKSKRRTRRS